MNNKLLSNFFSLSSLQAVNMFLPLLTLPYLVRVLGVSNFGLLSFSLSIIMYFNILVSFGFELSATKDISVNRQNIKDISDIFYTVLFIKLTLFFLSLIILSVLMLYINEIKDNFLLYYTTFGVVLGNVLFPSWFFQGMESMKHITYISVIIKIITTASIFSFVTESNNYIYVPLINSLGSIFGGFISLFVSIKLFKINFIFPSKESFIYRIKNSFHYFLSRIANNGSRYYATTLIGLYFGNSIVGYYSMVEKLFYALMSVAGVISQVLYPYMSRERNIIFFKKIFFYVTLISIITIIPFIYYNELIIKLIFKVYNETLYDLFIVMFGGAIFGIASMLLGYPLLGAFGFSNHANNSLIYSSFIYVIFITFSVLYMNDIYIVSFSLFVFNFSALLFRLYFCFKEKLFLKNR